MFSFQLKKKTCIFPINIINNIFLTTKVSCSNSRTLCKLGKKNISVTFAVYEASTEGLSSYMNDVLPTFFFLLKIITGFHDIRWVFASSTVVSFCPASTGHRIFNFFVQISLTVAILTLF